MELHVISLKYFCAAMQSKLKYWNGIYGLASKTIVRHLDVNAGNAMGIATWDFISTPIASLLAETSILLCSVTLTQSFLQAHSKQKSHPLTNPSTLTYIPSTDLSTPSQEQHYRNGSSPFLPSHLEPTASQNFQTVSPHPEHNLKFQYFHRFRLNLVTFELVVESLQYFTIY